MATGLITNWWWRQLMGAALVACWLALLLTLAVLVRRLWPGQSEWSRKVLHIGSGFAVLIAWGTGIDRWIALPVASAVTLVAALNHRMRVLPAIEDVNRHSYGTVAYGASITLLLLLWWPGHPAAVAAGVLVMAVGDGLAGLLGPLLPQPGWRVLGAPRSVMGTASMAAGSLAALLAVASLAGAASPPLGSLAAMAAAATLLEQFALLGVDNLSVPLAVGLLWHVLSPA